MPKKRKRGRWIMLGLLALAVVVIFNLVSGGPESVAGIEPVEVERGTVIRRLAETGTVEMDRTVEVKSQVAGRIRALHADVGDTVRSGQLLAVIEPDPDKALQLSGKRAAVTRAEMDLAEQRRLLEQKRQNHTDGIVSREELEKTEYQFKLAEIGLEQQRLELQILEREVKAQVEAVGATEQSLLFEDYEIYAPMEGIVTLRPVEAGELVTSAVSMNQGASIFTVGDPSRLIVKVQISEVDIGEMSIGLPAEVRVEALPGAAFQGRLRQLAPTGSIKQGSSVVTFEAEVEILTSDRRLRSGMTADVDIIIGRAEEVLWLPIEAVGEVFARDAEGNPTERVERTVVFVREGEGWSERTVETGLASNARVQVLTGIEEGTEVHPDAQTHLEEEQDAPQAGRPGAGPRGGR